MLSRQIWVGSLTGLIALGQLVAADAASIALRHTESHQADMAVAVGDMVPLEIFVDVGGLRTSAIEMHLTYDPFSLQISDMDLMTQGVQPFDPGTFYQGVELNNLVHDGVLAHSIGILGETDALATGAGVVARLQIRALRLGTTEIEFNASPQDWQKGQYTFFTLSDGAPKSFRDVQNARIAVRQEVLAQLRAIPDQTVLEDGLAEIALEDYLIAPPETEVEWLVETVGPIQIQVDELAQVLRIEPPQNWTGEQAVEVIATSTDGSVSKSQFGVAVVSDPAAPRLLELPTLELTEEVERRIPMDSYVVDQDTPLDALSWEVLEAVGLPVSIAENSRELVVAPQLGQSGTYSMRLRVADPEGHDDESVWEIHVIPHTGPVFSIRSFSPVETSSGNKLLIELQSHIQSELVAPEDLQWEVASDSEFVEAQVLAEGELEVTCSSGWSGTANLDLRATEPAGHAELTVIQIVVSPGSVPLYELKCAVLRNPVARDYLHVLAVVPEAVDVSRILGQFTFGTNIDLVLKQKQPRLWVTQVELPAAKDGPAQLRLQAYDAMGVQTGLADCHYVLQ